MSPENDLLFTHSDSLLMSDFGNLTELDNFPKDLFLSNAIEEIADGGLLGELDCKDDLKPLLNICDVDDAFGASLKAGVDEDPNSVKVRCSPFAMFMDEETSEPLGFMDMTPKMDLPKVSDGLQMQNMGLSSTLIKPAPPSGTIEQGVLSSPPALLAASKLNCMSLDELDLTHVNAKNALCAMSSTRPSLRPASSVLISGNGAELASSRTPLSPLGKAPINGKLFRKEALPPALPLCSAEMAVPAVLQINSPVTSPSSTKASFSSSDGGALINLMLRGEEVAGMHCVKGSLPQTAGVMAAEAIRRNFNVPDVMQSHSPSIQRSQSSHALGQLRILSGRVGPYNEEFNVLPSCKQEVPLSSNVSTVSLLTPYQAASTKGLNGSSPVAPIRRVYSTGDLQGVHGVPSFFGGNPDNVIAEEAAGGKIGHYTTEERKMKLHRYRQKRTERNFSKKIKYACRKTLADSRPRVRGRFARTDEMGDSSFRGSELPLIDEYEEVTSHLPRTIPENHRANVNFYEQGQQTYMMANSSCILSSNPIAQFWSTMGMKVAM